ncbi:MAG: hypothetical protein K8I27_02425 [Planctomycetes bacterium]|nr:hypothetical protein [Planctomycetota bacterium]
MADKNKKKGGSKAGTLLLVVLLLVVGVGVAGYFKPDLPVVGPLVNGFFEKGAEGMKKDGVYTVKITKVVLDPQEFDAGETVDVQVLIKHTNKEGKTETVWDSSKLGENLREVGENPLSVTHSETPFEITWQSGDQITVEIWDYKGLSNTRLAWYKTAATDKEFGLDGTRTLTLLDGDNARNPRVGGTNQIVFEASHKGPVPAEE